MALGYCMVCEKLVPIKAGPQKWGSRQRAWKPYPHDNPEGSHCSGENKEIR